MTYSGREELEAKRIPTSPLGRRVADLVGQVVGGLYRLSDATLRRIDWTRLDHIEIATYSGCLTHLSTFEPNGLTDLVAGAHHLCLRVELSPCLVPHDMAADDAATLPPQLGLKLVFEPRQRDGADDERHPTLKMAAARVVRLMRPRRMLV